MENSKRKSGLSRIALDYDLNRKLKAMALSLSQPGKRVTIEALVTQAVTEFLGKKRGI